MDPELYDILGDPELIRVARKLSSASAPEPPLDDAFKSSLRRELMAEAWRSAEGKNAWWRRVFAPAGLAWVGAAAMVVIVASVVLYTTSQPTGGLNQTVIVTSPQKDSGAVALRDPILVSFNQPMDHQSTEAAVQITPATTVAFRWSDDKTLYVQPTSGNLAPNTQYLVTIGPGAKTQGGNQIDTPKTFTFVTQPTASPPASPSPTPKSNSFGQQLTTAYPPSGTTYPVVWSADSSTVYFVGAGGVLESVPAKGGATKTLVADGASLPAIAPAGDRLAYVRGGKIEILNLVTGQTTELVVAPAPTALAWVRDQLYWGTNEGVYQDTANGPTRIASIPPPNEATAILSIAPDGAHAAFGRANSLFLLDIRSGITANLGQVGAGTTFQGWSPDGSRIVYNGLIADMTGRTVSSLPAADVSWSAKNEILLGSDSGLFAVRPDGTGLTKLADGTYNLPVWAPDSSTFVFVRGGLWVATAPDLSPAPAQTDQALAVVNAFMQARKDGNSDRALLYLTDAGKAAYNTGHPQLIPITDLRFRRFYVLYAETDPATAGTVRVVVRMVFGHAQVEQSTVEETLTLRRAQATDPYLIDAVSVATPRDVGKGPEVVAVKITAPQVEVTFDSDLVPTSVSSVTLQDGQGKVVDATMSYADRVVMFSGLQLTPGARYRLVVLSNLVDVGTRHIAAEYDLDFVGPAPDATSGDVTPTPAPSPSQAPAARPSRSPRPTASPSPTAS
jgi:Bacterial Ig-like domain